MAPELLPLFTLRLRGFFPSAMTAKMVYIMWLLSHREGHARASDPLYPHAPGHHSLHTRCRRP